VSLTRNQRRQLRKGLEERAKTYTDALSPVPESEWPAPGDGHERPVALWRSKRFLVQVYQEDIDSLRLTVVRVTMGADGHWEDGITWDELQLLKREAGYGDWYGVEVYPRDRDIVCDCKMRHLWIFSTPIPIGWFSP
jgi:hypothetical protein